MKLDVLIDRVKTLQIGEVTGHDWYHTCRVAAMSRPIYDPADPLNSLQHFDDKLLLLAEGMRTKAGKRLAQARHAFLVQFKEEFLKEWNAENIG